MSKRTQEDAGEEGVTAKSKPMMNLVSRCSVRDPDVLASTAWESPEKTKSESQLPLSSWNEQQPRTVRPVLGASSLDYSEWNFDEKWSSQEWKSDEILEARTGPVGGQPASSFTQQTDWFVIEDDGMDSDTATESNLSLRSRSFLNRVNDRLRKILNQSSKDATKDSDKHSMIWGMFMSSTLEASLFMGKNYSEILHSIKNTGKDLTLKQMFEISEKLTLEQSAEIFEVTPKLGRFFMESVIFGQWWRSHQSLACKSQRIFRFCFVSWKDKREPWIKYGMGRQIGVVQKFTGIQNVGHNWWWADGIRVEYFPKVHHISALQQSPRVHV